MSGWYTVQLLASAIPFRFGMELMANGWVDMATMSRCRGTRPLLRSRKERATQFVENPLTDELFDVRQRLVESDNIGS